jgi:hypothetical protein
MEEFITKVAEMRRLQKEYFTRSRDKYTLMACKKAESEVDDFLATGKVNAKAPVADARQPSLF